MMLLSIAEEPGYIVEMTRGPSVAPSFRSFHPKLVWVTVWPQTIWDQIPSRKGVNC